MAALAVVAVWAFWIVAAQALLWTPLFRKLFNARWPDVRLEYRFAWSVFPGTVHARGFVLGKQDSGVEWQVGIERVSADLALGELRHRVFHATRVRASGVSFRLRPRLARETLSRGQLAGLPPIEGYEAVPLLLEGPDDDPDDAHYRLVTVWLEDVESDALREIWIGRYRAHGTARLAGSFYYRPHRQLLVAPAELRVERFALEAHGAQLLSGLHGDLRLQVAKIDPRSDLAQVLHAVDLDLRLDGRVEGLAAVARGLGADARGGAGPLRASLRLVHGALQPGADAGFALGPAEILAGDTRGRLAGLSVELRSARAGAGELDAEARMASLGDALDLARGRLQLALSPAELPVPGVTGAQLELEGGVVRDPGAALALFAPGLARAVHFERGAGTFAVHLAGPAQALAGSAFVSLLGARARARGATFEADARLEARVRALDPARGADLSGTRLAVAGARVVNPGGAVDAARDWWGRFEFPRARLQLAPVAGAPLVDATLSARCRDARPIVGLYVRRSSLPGFVGGLFAMDGLSVDGALALARDGFALRDLDARGDAASIRATLLREGPVERGAALLTVRGIPLALDLDGGHTALHLFGPGDFYAQKQRALAGGGPHPLARAPRRRRRP